MDQKVTWDGRGNQAKTPQPAPEAHADRAHSTIVGGSSAGRVIECPGSVELSTHFPSQETSSFAEEGTALHEAVEYVMTSEMDNDEDIIGHSFNGHKITQEMYDSALRPALEFFDKLQDEYGDLDYVTEQRVSIPEIPGAFGAVDLPIAASAVGIVLDWKFGAGVRVSAENNRQMQFYAHGIRSHPKLKSMLPRDKPIELIVAQPRIEYGFTRWMTDHTQLDIFVKELVRAVDIARDPAIKEYVNLLMDDLADLYDRENVSVKEDILHDMKTGMLALIEQFSYPVFKEGDHCRWCPGKKGCPVKNLAANMALMVPKEEAYGEITVWLNVAEELKDWIREVEQWAFKRLEEGHEVEGYKLVAKEARRKWADEDAAYKQFSAMRSVKADEFAPRSMLSVAQMEKLLKLKKQPKMSDDMVVKKSSGLKMVPESAKGEAVNLSTKQLEGLDTYLT